ncbi:rubredoxin-like domain-containing protein, partial [Haematococcus lacustris]
MATSSFAGKSISSSRLSSGLRAGLSRKSVQVHAKVAARAKTANYVCVDCGYLYDGKKGAFEDLPGSYACPVQGVHWQQEEQRQQDHVSEGSRAAGAVGGAGREGGGGQHHPAGLRGCCSAVPGGGLLLCCVGTVKQQLEGTGGCWADWALALAQ